MALLELSFKVLLLAGLPLGILIGIHRAKAFWPLAFLTFIGATITVINLRIAAQLSQLKAQPPSMSEVPSGAAYHVASWILAITILAFGLYKMHRLRISQAVAELLKDEG
ncbi:MAG: hypothetical protein ACSHYB_09570 [Roseibacillus sp.]